MKRYTIFLFLTVLLCAACSRRKDTRNLMGPWDELVSVVTEEGWTHYTAGEYARALDRFGLALEFDSDYADAYNGQGWSYTRLDSLDEAMGCFDLAMEKGAEAPTDALVGKAALCLRTADFDNAIDYANRALEADSLYVFQHDPNVHWKTVHLILAQAYYGGRKYAEARREVDILDPTCGLNAVDPATWAVGGKAYASYEEALLMAIERLLEQ
ncbi:MAG: hypothetical protein J7M27_12045 [Candidatus Latescibacteria bacterium]|nr:hypothetical protein [Candidatus Latescibacterota bacterium]